MCDETENGVGNMKCDYNSFIRIGGSKFRFTKGAVGKKDYKDFMDNAHISKWRTKTGFDKHSFFLNKSEAYTASHGCYNGWYIRNDLSFKY